MMRANTSRRITKPIVFAIMLIALTLVCGLLFSSLPFNRDIKAHASMSKPSGGYNDGAFSWTSDHITDKTQQSGMTTISNISFSASGIVNFSGADNTDKISGTYSGSGFGTNSWSYTTCPAGSAVLYRPVFFHTYKLTDEVYENIAGGYATVSVSKDGDLSYSNGGAFDVRVSAYLSIGTATSDENAKTYANYNETKVQNGAMTDPVDNVDSLNTNFNNVFNNISKDLTTTSIPSGNKYLRVGVYFEIWPGSSSSTTSNLSLSNISLNVSISPSMSLPTGNHTAGSIGYFNNGSTQQRVVQNDMQSLSLSSMPTATNFTGVDNIAWINTNTNSSIANENKFNSTKNGWSTYVNSTGTMFHPGFMYTYKLTDADYNSIKAGTLKVSLTVNGQLSLTKEDNRLFMYVGIGTSSSDDLAKTFAGFMEKAYDIDIANDGANSGYLNAAFSCVSSNGGMINKSFNNANLVANSNAEKTYKYLRVAVFFETWSDVAQTITYSNMSMDVSLEEQVPVDSSVPTTNSMTKPSGWGSYTFYDDVSNSSNFCAQTSMVEIGHSGNSLTSSNTSLFPTSGNGIYRSGWGQTGTSGDAVFSGVSTVLPTGLEGYSHTFNHTSGTPSQMGLFYTLKLTETVYNALMSGAISITLETPNLSASGLGSSGAGRAQFYSYLGIGYAANDNYAKYGNAFTETKGYIGGSCTYYASNSGYSNESATNCNISNFRFTNSSVVSKNYTGNGNTKYLRFGVWGRFYVSGTDSNCSGVKLTSGTFTISLSPTSDSSAPSIPSDVTSSASVTISDASGLDYYTINGKKVDVSKISNTSFSANTTVTLPSQGTYSISAVDIWGNSSSTITFDYFYANIVAQANTDGAQNDYTGGKIVFNANYNSGNGYQSQQITNNGAYNSRFNIWAKPNDGYYFAGFTLGSHYSSINLNLSSSSSLSDTTVKSGSNGNYNNIKVDTLEYMFTWNAYTNLIIPTDGKIYITANFKAIPTTNNQGEYNKNYKTVSIGSISNVPGVGSMASSVVYGGTSNSTTAPIVAGTYTATSTITWNSINVGIKTEDIVITPKQITANYAQSVNSTYYRATTDVSDLIETTINASDICSGDTVNVTDNAQLSDKNVGERIVTVTTTINNTNYQLTNPTVTLNMTVEEAPVTVIFEAVDRPYNGTNIAMVNIISITGVVGSESILYNDLSATYADKYAGDNKKVTLTNPVATAGEGTSLANYSITTNENSLTANISKIELIVNYTLAKTKAYDGNNTAAVSGEGVEGYVAGDESDLTPVVVAYYKDVNVNNDIDVDVTIDVTGDESRNYYWTTSATVKGDITLRNVTIKAVSNTKVYGEADPELSYMIDESSLDFVNEDDRANANIKVARTVGENVSDSYPINVTFTPISNYYLIAVDGTFSITKRPVTVTLKEQGGVYGTDGLGVDQGAYEVSASGGYDYLDHDLGITISKTGDMEVGSHALSATASNTNYEVNFVIENDFVITKRDLTIALSEQGSIYGEEINLSNTAFTTTGLVSGDSVEVIITKADGTQKGEYALSGVLNTESASYAHVVKNYNYTIVPGVYTISRREITIILVSQGSVYGITPVVNQGTEYFNLDTTDGKFDLASGDTKEDLNLTIAKEEGVNVGEYALTFNWNNDNYEVSGASGVYTITKATLDVTYETETITYGDTPGYVVTYAGFKYTDGESAVSTKATLDTSSLAYTGSYITANAEGYLITPKGAKADNYDFNYIAGTLIVSKKDLSVAYNEEITYGESAVTSITASEFTITGLLYDEGASVLTLTANLPTNAGTHTITSDNFTFNATNYEVTSVSGSLKINKAQLEIIIGAPLDAYYGDSIALNITYGTTGKNFVNGENADVALTQKVVYSLDSITNEKGYVKANESGYDVATLITQYATANNYEITHTVQTLYVHKKEFTLTYQGESKVYDALVPTPSKDRVEVSGLVDGESLQYLNESEGFDYNLVVSAPKATVGQYVVYATYVYGGGRTELENYNVNFIRNYYNITEATLTATYVSESIVFGGTPVGTVTYSGFMGSDNEDVVTTKATVPFESIDNVTVLGENSYVNVKEGGYTLTPQGATAVNYTFNYVAGTLTVTKLDASLVLLNQTSVYGITPVVGQGSDCYEISGLLEGDSLTSITITKEEGVTVGGYVLDAIVVAPNYEVEVTKATYNITKATLDVTISFNRNSVIDVDVASLTTGDFTIEYAGWQYTDDESLLDTPVSVDVDAIIATAVEAGEYDILYIAGLDDQYLFNYLNIGTIVVVASEKDVDTTGLTFENKVVTYNGEEQSLYVTWENQPTDVEVRITYSYSKPSRINQGIYTVTASFEVLTAGYKNEIDSMVAILTIKPVEIEIALAPQGSAYGEPIVVNQGSDYYTVISGTVLEKDDLGVNITKSDVMNANHGEYDLDATITNTNYVLTNDPHNVYTISSLDVTVSLRDQIGVYGKSTNISQTEYDITSGALVNESDMVITLSVEYKELYEVGGSYLITAEIQPNPWYVFSVVDATYTVTARDIEITLNDVNVYYGTEVSAVTTYEITSGELVEANEDLGLTFSITQANKYVVGGDYVISATASNVNYVVSVINAKYIVVPKNVEIIVSDQESVYGDGYVVFNNFELKEGFSLVEGDTKDDLGVRVIVKNPSDNAGEYVLSATINSANYSVKVNDGKYVINKAETILYTDKLLKSYDYTGNAINFNTVNSYVYSNRPASQAGIIKLPTQTVVNAGQYTVTFSINESNNFTSASVEVEIVVNKVAPVVDMTVLLAKTYIYNGAEQEITADKNELVKKADLDEVSLSWEDNRFTSVPEGEKLVVKVTLSETTNYLSKSFTQTVPIRKAEYDFSGYAYAFDSKTVPYDGEHHSIEVVNLPAGISVSYSYNDQEQETPFQFKNAGIYIINAIYSFDEVNYNRPKELISNSYVQIDRINITVNVVDQQGFYGDEPEFDPKGISVIAGNFVSGDPIDLVLELEPRDSYPIGVYKLVANTTSSGNYNVTIASGSYSIIARPITVTIDDRTSQYGDPDVPYSYQITSGELVNNDVLTASLVREEGKLPGEYTISGTVVNPNYAVKVIPGTYTITPRAIVVEVYNQEGTSAKQLNKRAYKTFGKILRGDNLNIQVVGEIGTEPGEYPLTVTYAENPNYSVEIREGIFTLRKVSKIKVSNPIVSKLYDGVPYVFDVSVSSGATPIFSIDGMYVENSFTEVGVYNLSINADVLGDFASPDTYRITFEIRPTELTVEKDGIFFKVTKADGFGAEEKLEVEHDQTLALSGEDYTSKIDAAYSIYIVQGEEKISLEEYMQGEEVHIKIKLNETLTEIGAETWFVDSSSNVLHEAQLPDENGYIEVTLADGNHILFVTDRDEATPILVVGSSMALIFVIMGFFFLFRKKFIN